MDVTTTQCTPIATPTVVRGNVFFRQRGDQLNGIVKQPVRMAGFFCTIVVHRRLGTDQCDGSTIV